MSIEDTLVAFLKTLSTVTAIIGTGNAARIRPDRLGQDETLPAILMEIDDEEPENDLLGQGGLVYSEVTLTCRANEKADARALAEAIRINGADPGTGMAGYHGTVGGVMFDAVLESTTMAWTTESEGSEAGWFDVLAEYTVSHVETV